MPIADHAFLPCFYAAPPSRRHSAQVLGLCLNPAGMDRCHIKGCGRPPEEHVAVERRPGRTPLRGRPLDDDGRIAFLTVAEHEADADR